MKKSVALLILIAISLNAISQKKPILDGESKRKGYENHEAMRAKSAYDTLHWQFIGPTNISGRCTDVEAVRPRGKSYTIWVAAASSGIWKSVNEGITFEPVFENYGTTTIGDIAIAPSNPEIVWAGTGEANIFRSSNAGCGVYKTEDGGETWEHMGLENTFTISRIVVHPEFLSTTILGCRLQRKAGDDITRVVARQPVLRWRFATPSRPLLRTHELPS